MRTYFIYSILQQHETSKRNNYIYYSLINFTVDLWVKIVRYGQQDHLRKTKGQSLCFHHFYFRNHQDFKGLLFKSTCFCFHKITNVCMKTTISLLPLCPEYNDYRMLSLISQMLAYAFRIKKVLTYENEGNTLGNSLRE